MYICTQIFYTNVGRYFFTNICTYIRVTLNFQLLFFLSYSLTFVPIQKMKLRGIRCAIEKNLQGTKFIEIFEISIGQSWKNEEKFEFFLFQIYPISMQSKFNNRSFFIRHLKGLSPVQTHIFLSWTENSQYISR